MLIQPFRKPNSLENDSLLTQIQDIDPTWDPLILAQNKQMTRSELMKGFLTWLTKQTLIGIHKDFKRLLAGKVSVRLLKACLCPLDLTTVLFKTYKTNSSGRLLWNGRVSSK